MTRRSHGRPLGRGLIFVGLGWFGACGNALVGALHRVVCVRFALRVAVEPRAQGAVGLGRALANHSGLSTRCGGLPPRRYMSRTPFRAARPQALHLHGVVGWSGFATVLVVCTADGSAASRSYRPVSLTGESSLLAALRAGC